MASEDDLRAIAMSLPETEERATYRHRPSWKVRGRGFVGIWKDETSAVLLTEGLAEKQALLASEPDKFFTTAHYGDSARLLVRLANVAAAELRDLVTESWRQSAPPDLVAAFDGRRKP